MRNIFFIFGLLLALPLLGEQWPRTKIDKANRIVDKIQSVAISNIESKYRMKCIGSGAAMFGGPLRIINLAFASKGPLSQAELRRLVVACYEEVKNAVMTIPEAQGILYNPIFDLNNVSLDIYVTDQFGHDLFEPDICLASTVCGEIRYRYSDPEERIFPFKKSIKETYEEALEAIRREGEVLKGKHEE